MHWQDGNALGRKQVCCAALPDCTGRGAAPAPTAGALQLCVQVPSMEGSLNYVGMQASQGQAAASDAASPDLHKRCCCHHCSIRDRRDDLTSVQSHKH